ncbi:MAG: hypothetical protein QXR45_10985 [Candidatus Bathyarchaeia archaeon]
MSIHSLTTPFIVRYLGERIKKWTDLNGALYIEPSNASFDLLIIRPHWIQFSLDRKWEFTSILSLTPEKTSKIKGIKEKYKNLKELECEMKWRGFLRRKAYFRSFPDTFKLESMVNGFKPNPRLAEALNNDFDLIKLIESIRPDSITVTLQSIDESLAYFISSEEEYFNALINYLNNPSKIVWTITSFRCLHTGLSHKRNVVGMFDILDRISSHVKHLSNSYLFKSK